MCLPVHTLPVHTHSTQCQYTRHISVGIQIQRLALPVWHDLANNTNCQRGLKQQQTRQPSWPGRQNTVKMIQNQGLRTKLSISCDVFTHLEFW